MLTEEETFYYGELHGVYVPKKKRWVRTYVYEKGVCRELYSYQTSQNAFIPRTATVPVQHQHTQTQATNKLTHAHRTDINNTPSRIQQKRKHVL